MGSISIEHTVPSALLVLPEELIELLSSYLHLLWAVWIEHMSKDVSIINLVYTKVKVKYLRGAVLRSRSFKGPYFPCPWRQTLALCPRLLHNLSVTHTNPLWGSALTDTITNNIYLKYAQLNFHTLASFVPSIIHNLMGAAYSPNGFHK